MRANPKHLKNGALSVTARNMEDIEQTIKKQEKIDVQDKSKDKEREREKEKDL